MPLAVVDGAARDLQLDARGNVRLIEHGIFTDINVGTLPPQATTNPFTQFVGEKMTHANLQRLAAYAHHARQRYEQFRARDDLTWENTITTSSTCTWHINTEVNWYPANAGATVTVHGGTGAVTINNCIITTDANTGAGAFTVGNGWILQAGANGVYNWQYDAPPKAPGHFESPLKNHRGAYIRSNDNGRQFDGVSRPEMLALQLLRGMVSQEEFRRYLKHGHINVRGATGLVYQIKRYAPQVGRYDRIQVWERGQHIASLCVHLKHGLNTPPTDEVVGKLLMVEYDEADLWKRSNVTWHTQRRHEIAAEKGNSGLVNAQGIYIANGAENILTELVQGVA